MNNDKDTRCSLKKIFTKTIFVIMVAFYLTGIIFIIMFCDAKVKRYEAGEYITLGRYEQDNNFDNGAEDIEWLILDSTDDRLLVISRYCLDKKNITI